ncbi:similar to Saccharomyces cerevisiae YJR057W CDC8 Thymidylate and uridylate kinase, functions in de novo biosynthesis of pyrimidine deoxyribonucleotides [Maudiozyma saulgeensis]|uniref:Thymidylate kinase n=1 Tax=Maudiozyma saulgeensis TaxID=1789683 RepID=A0A1X7R1H3_9SACH|nr:similar to Saccharomyces cerevisiae YJR057W CDC8 Thymidylate and uridylate kinase, functions in de novo biosynthesis of pyrimidine deoxyribonucleotides [Kazachstania saulgeensis]
MSNPRGKLILIEGLDRTGKSTQCEILRQRLGESTTLMKFPDRTTAIGQQINNYLIDSSYNLPDQAAHLLFSANRWERNDYIRNKLLDGENIVMDRYVYSGVAYSAAKEITGMDLEWCYSCDRGLVRPDLTLFLVNNESNDNREGFGEERYENNSFQEKVRQQFYKLFEKQASLNEDNNDVVIVNVTGCTIEQVSEKIWTIVQNNKEISSSTFKLFE